MKTSRRKLINALAGCYARDLPALYEPGSDEILFSDMRLEQIGQLIHYYNEYGCCGVLEHDEFKGLRWVFIMIRINEEEEEHEN